MIDAYWLPVIFAGLMALSILVYAMLDGYDLGVGILMPLHKDEEPTRDIMIASIGPFWDANETWLVLAVGLLLIAFPSAYNQLFYYLYIPTIVMLIGLVLRGVAFDFRAKAAVSYKLIWDYCFKAGSLLTSLAQGYMLGMYVMGFNTDPSSIMFCLLSALGVTAAYCYIGAAWLIIKAENQLQHRAVHWAILCGRVTFIGVVAVCIVNLWVNPEVYSRWFTFPLVMFVLLLPALCMSAFFANDFLLKKLPLTNDRLNWLPFVITAVIFMGCFCGLAFSFYPEIFPGKLTIWQAASAPESLRFILVGALIVIPVILAYTFFAYKVFHGKATALRYH